jgi:hypothetical protein
MLEAHSQLASYFNMLPRAPGVVSAGRSTILHSLTFFNHRLPWADHGEECAACRCDEIRPAARAVEIGIDDCNVIVDGGLQGLAPGARCPTRERPRLSLPATKSEFRHRRGDHGLD